MDTNKNFGFVVPVIGGQAIRQWRFPDIARLASFKQMQMAGVYRNACSRLAEQWLNEGRQDSALYYLDLCYNMLPPEIAPLLKKAVRMAEMYYKTGDTARADSILIAVSKNMAEKKVVQSKRMKQYRINVRQRAYRAAHENKRGHILN